MREREREGKRGREREREELGETEKILFMEKVKEGCSRNFANYIYHGYLIDFLFMRHEIFWLAGCGFINAY